MNSAWSQAPVMNLICLIPELNRLLHEKLNIF